MSVVDASVLIAALVVDDSMHSEAQQLLALGPVRVTWGALHEVALVIRRRAKDKGQPGHKAASRALAAVMAMAGFVKAPAVPLEVVIRRHAGAGHLSFTDAWNLEVALASGEALLTFDRDLLRAHARATRPG